MFLRDSDAISAVAHGPIARRDRVRALVAEMSRRQFPVGTVAAVLAEVVLGYPEMLACSPGFGGNESRCTRSTRESAAGLGNSSARPAPDPGAPWTRLSSPSPTSTVEPSSRPSAPTTLSLLASHATLVAIADIR
jgi:hypothetical protein